VIRVVPTAMALRVVSSSFSAWTAKAKSQRLPTNTVEEEEEESCSKESLCLSPFSQASTAPSTPLRFFLPDPFEFDICMSMLSDHIKQVEKTNMFNAAQQPIASFFSSPPPLSVSMSPWWAEYKQHGTEAILGSCEASRKSTSSQSRPRSQQQFAVLESVRNYKKEHQPRSQQQFAVLEFVDNHYYQVKEHMPRSQQLFAVLEYVRNIKKEHKPRSQQQFAVLEYVDNHNYQVKMHFPRSPQLFAVLVLVRIYKKEHQPRSQQQYAVLEFADKHDYQIAENASLIEHFGLDMAGLMKHFGSNSKEANPDAELDDEEWTKVDELYIPSERDGMCVLAANPDSVGNALTSDESTASI